MNILLVEDSNLDAQAFRSAFKDSQALPTIAYFNCAEEALKKLSEDAASFDVVVSDYHLPKMSGLEFHSELIERNIHLPFVLLTVQGAEQLAVKALKAGVQEYLPKDLVGLYLKIIPDLLEKAVRSFQDSLKQVEVEKKQRLAAEIFETTFDAIAVADSKKTITHVNPAFTNTTGFDEKDVIGSSLSTLASDQDIQTINPEIWHAVENDGKWRGEILIRCKHGQCIPAWLSISHLKDEREIVTNYIAVFSDISKLVEAERVNRRRANYDALTELPNRALFYDRLKQAIRMALREKSILAVMLIDLDDFKAINDTHGHLAGDFVLKAAAMRMMACVRNSDTVARLAGDEFTVTLTKITRAEDAAIIARKLLAELARPIRWQQTELCVSASIGIALLPTHGTDIDSLICNADTAMYQSKKEGRNSFNFFTEDMRRTAIE